MLWLLPVGCLAAGIGCALVFTPPNVWLVLILVVLSGFGVASYHPEGYKAASFFTGERKVVGMSVFSVGGNLGFAIGPILVATLITCWGFRFFPVLCVPSIALVVYLLVYWKEISATVAKPKKVALHRTPQPYPRGTFLTMMVIILVVVIRSAIQLGLLSYIPFYYINHLKGDPIYAGQLVSTFLIGGAIGTLAGAPLADRWGHKRYLIFSMLATSLLFPGIYFLQGIWLFAILSLIGMVLVSTFSVTVVMAQQLLHRHLGIASGLMVGFAIGTGGLWVTILGVIADHFGVPAALKSIMIFPVVGLLLSAAVKYPLAEQSGEKEQRAS